MDQISAAKERKIADIKAGDGRVRFIGTFLNGSGNEVILDDGTGSICVVFDDAGLAQRAREWRTVRIFGSVSGDSAEAIRGEIVQDMRKLNIEQYRKIISHEKTGEI
jgi:hypothetical protein